MQLLKFLLPKEDKFLSLFERHAAEIVAGAASLQAGLSTGGIARLPEVTAHEEAADLLTAEILLAARKSFITPFDRGAIKDLVTAMDDSLDEMNKTVGDIALFELKQFDADMLGMAERIVTASGLVAQAIPMLRDMGSRAGDIIALCERIVVIEGEADTIHKAGIKTLWDRRVEAPGYKPGLMMIPGKEVTPAGLERFMVGERVLDSLEKVMDRLEDVANVLHGIVIEHV